MRTLHPIAMRPVIQKSEPNLTGHPWETASRSVATAAHHPSRRQFVTAGGVIGVCTMLPACPQGIQGVLTAVKMAQDVFTVLEPILGSFRMRNTSSRTASISVFTSFLDSDTFEAVEDALECVTDLPPNSGFMDVLFCFDDVLLEIGKYITQASALTDDVESDPFDVVDA